MGVLLWLCARFALSQAACGSGDVKWSGWNLASVSEGEPESEFYCVCVCVYSVFGILIAISDAQPLRQCKHLC